MNTITKQQCIQVGRSGGSVDTKGMSRPDKDKVDAWVADGRKGTK